MDKEAGRENRHGEAETGKDVQTESRDKARCILERWKQRHH